MPNINDLINEAAQYQAERDAAVNCIYEVRKALEQGDPKAAFEEIINWEFNISKEKKSSDSKV